MSNNELWGHFIDDSGNNRQDNSFSDFTVAYQEKSFSKGATFLKVLGNPLFKSKEFKVLS